MTNISKLKTITQEILGEERLIELLTDIKTKGKVVNHYIGYEVSGKPHIGHGILCMMIIKELQSLGVNCRIFIADWHAWINDKLGGDWELISGIGVKLFKEYMIAGAKCVGVDLEKLEFITGSELYKGDYYKNNPDKIIGDNTDDFSSPLKYWETFIKVSKKTNLARIQRSIDIMGRKEGDIINFSSLIYPPMQAADIFYMQNHIAHGGMDQRKIHVVAIDLGNDMNFKPVAIHHKLILGLAAPSTETLRKLSAGEEIAAEDVKMSKSKPNTAIFMDDTETEIREKIKKAYCPEGIQELNPILDWCEGIVFPIQNELTITRKSEWGGNKTYNNYQELVNDFKNKALHPVDLKNAVADFFVNLMKPAMEHLNTKEIIEMKEIIQQKTSR